MDPGTITVIIAIAGATGTVLSFFVGRRERSEASRANVASHLSDSYKKLVDSLETRVDAIEIENKSLKETVSILRKESNSKDNQISDLKNENALLKARVEILEKELTRSNTK